MLQEDEVTLTELGLTERQARVLLSLARCKFATAKAIAHASSLPRQDVYQVLDELQELGFLEKKVGTPTEFVGIPMSDVCSELLARRVEKTSDLMSKTKTLVGCFQEADELEAADDDAGVFLVPERRAFVHRITKSIEAAQESIDVITARKFLGQGLFSLTDELNRAMKRDVQIRFLMNNSDVADLESSFLRSFLENPCFKMKTTAGHESLRFSVYDKKEVSVVLTSKGDFAKSSLLWSNSTSLVKVFQDHFDMLWLSANER